MLILRNVSYVVFDPRYTFHKNIYCSSSSTLHELSLYLFMSVLNYFEMIFPQAHFCDICNFIPRINVSHRSSSHLILLTIRIII